jgi:hypothetical protein
MIEESNESEEKTTAAIPVSNTLAVARDPAVDCDLEVNRASTLPDPRSPSQIKPRLSQTQIASEVNDTPSSLISSPNVENNLSCLSVQILPCYPGTPSSTFSISSFSSEGNSRSLSRHPSLSSTPSISSFSSDSNSRSLSRHPSLSSTPSISSFSSDSNSRSLSRHPSLSSTPSISSFSSDSNSRSLSRHLSLSSTPSISSFSSDSNSQSLSRYPTLSSTSSTSSISSFSLDGNENQGNGELKLTRILSVVREVNNKCRICWVNRTRTSTHPTYRCISPASRKGGWELFKKGLLFEAGQVCFFCLAPYCPPFNHAQPSPGTPRSHKLCQYRDVLKELVYILYENQPLRQKIFARLGDTMPSSLGRYQQYISEKKGGIFGAYNVINAYLDIRDEGEAGDR